MGRNPRYSSPDAIEIILVVIAMLLFTIGVLGVIGVLGQQPINSNPPVYFNRQEDINPQNMNDILRWVSDNFARLGHISSFKTIRVAPGDTVIVTRNSILIVGD